MSRFRNNIVKYVETFHICFKLALPVDMQRFKMFRKTVAVFLISKNLY